MDTLLQIFCDVDDFCAVFMPQWRKHLVDSGNKKRHRAMRMTSSEIMTILIAFHQYGYRDFKTFYLGYVSQFWRGDFPELLSYTRFLEVMPSVLVPLCAYFTQLKGTPSGIGFIDSTSLVVSHNLRIPRHQVFKGVAARGRNSMGWFYGFKLHLLTNHRGEIVAAKLTAANVDDRAAVNELTQHMTGKLYGDKGYISRALGEELLERDLELITNVRANMKPKALSLWDKLMLKKRFIIETINDQLKNISQIEHSRHRSIHGFMLNLISGLIAYCLKPNKPSITIESQELALLNGRFV